MKKILLSLFTALLITFGGMTSIQADEYLRVGMEAAYAPFNWTQNDNTNGAVPIEGTDQYANGYDVQVAKKLAKKLNKKVVVVKTKWEGLVPALTSGKLDMIIAGMSPTEERKKEINFSKPYYISEPTLVVNAEGKYTNAKNISDFKNAKVTAQQGVYLYNLIDQINGVKKEVAMGDFNQLRQAVESGVVDAYVSERPDATSAQTANPKLKMIELHQGFKTSDADTNISVGMRKGDNRINQVNQVLESISRDKQIALMDKMIKEQPSVKKEKNGKPNFFEQMATILKNNGSQFLRGTATTLLISMVG
ncbi:MAG: transporter substrate-binding domain-containing protein, partial [Streptococcus agalactiae]